MWRKIHLPVFAVHRGFLVPGKLVPRVVIMPYFGHHFVMVEVHEFQPLTVRLRQKLAGIVCKQL